MIDFTKHQPKRIYFNVDRWPEFERLAMFVDETSYNMVKNYWGLEEAKRGRFGYNSKWICKEAPYYETYNRKDIKTLCKIETGKI